MKYAEQIKEYIENNGNIGERHEEPEIKLDHPRDPLTGAQLRDIDPEFEEVQEAPKKKRGRPAGSKNKTNKKASIAPVAKKRRGRPAGSKTKTRKNPKAVNIQQTVTFTPKLHEIITREAIKNFRPFSNEVQYILTKYYNDEM